MIGFLMSCPTSHPAAPVLPLPPSATTFELGLEEVAKFASNFAQVFRGWK
jgi:hypothetical protein